MVDAVKGCVTNCILACTGFVGGTSNGSTGSTAVWMKGSDPDFERFSQWKVKKRKEPENINCLKIWKIIFQTFILGILYFWGTQPLNFQGRHISHFPPKSINLRLPQFSELSEPKNQGEKNAMNTIPSYFFTIFNSSPWKIRSKFLPPKKGSYLSFPSIFSDFSKLLRSLVGKKRFPS